MEYKSLIISKKSDSNLNNLIIKMRNNLDFEICPLYESIYTNDYNVCMGKDSIDDYNRMQSKQITRLLEDNNYIVGYDKKALDNVIKQNKVPIFIVDPIYLKKLNEAVTDANLMAMSFLLKNVDEINDDIKDIENQCFSEINYVMEIKKTSRVYELILKLWEFRQAGGGIHRELISLMLECGMLIKKGNEKSISNASYDMSLGDEYFYGGKIKSLSEKDPFLMIEPYDYVIASCEELINFPRDIVAKFDVSVDLFCQGIILSNSTQVDPGFKGKLFCLLFNTSNKVVCIKRREHFVTLDFQKLLEATTPYSGRFSGKESIIYYLPNNVMQGALNELKKEIEQLKNESKNMQNMYMSILALILAVIAIIIVF